MKLIWDEPKRLSNLDKHGLDFADVLDFEWETAIIGPAHSGRFKAIGRFRNGATVVIYGLLGTEALSIISFRRASDRERKVLNGSFD